MNATESRSFGKEGTGLGNAWQASRKPWKVEDTQRAIEAEMDRQKETQGSSEVGEADQ